MSKQVCRYTQRKTITAAPSRPNVTTVIDTAIKSAPAIINAMAHLLDVLGRLNGGGL